MTAERLVDSSDGVRVAVHEQGNPDGPTLVLVQGRPDSHAVWDGVVPRLAARFRVVCYDNRSKAYGDDFAAVVDAVAPGQRVHVLAHGWGSAGIWDYLARPAASDQIASFTSVSGPSSGHVVRYITGGLKQPYRPKRFVRSLTQLLRLSPLGANIFRGRSSPRTDHVVDVPVQLIVNTGDRYVRPYVYDEIKQWVPRLWRRDIKAGHRSPTSHPQVMAAAVAEFVDFLEGRPPSRALLRAQVGRPREYFGDTLVSVTGAGSGIGRQTALAFARQGAEVVISDIDEASVKDTAAQIAEHGGIAHTYTLDVSDADAVERFAEQVCADHGVPDVVVNNAGIGHAGLFLDTPAEEFDRVLDVNLGGVVNGCRSFARRLVERGTGGHIVNVASMAAYSPQQMMNAYCTSKAAVYMFGDCLRAELDSAGIGLTTVCPGVVDTNIVRTARFDVPAGGKPHAESRRKQFEKMFAARRYGADKVATAIVSAVKKDKPIRPVTPEAYFVYGAAHVLPQAMRSAARGKLL